MPWTNDVGRSSISKGLSTQVSYFSLNYDIYDSSLGTPNWLGNLEHPALAAVLLEEENPNRLFNRRYLQTLGKSFLP